MVDTLCYHNSQLPLFFSVMIVLGVGLVVVIGYEYVVTLLCTTIVAHFIFDMIIWEGRGCQRLGAKENGNS